MASILDLASVISAHTSIEEQIAWFQSKGLLARTKSCPTCNHAMDMQRGATSVINICIYNGMHYITKQLSVYRWIHNEKFFCVKVEVSSVDLQEVGWPSRWHFFDKSKLSLRQWVVLMYWWIRQYPVSDAAQEAEYRRRL